MHGVAFMIAKLVENVASFEVQILKFFMLIILRVGETI